MLATACSNDEVVNVAPQSAAIGFKSFIDKATRAVDNDGETLKTLKVWGVTSRDADAEGNGKVDPTELFFGTVVTKEGSDWTYTNTQYWIPGNNYSFAAVAPADALGVKVNQDASLNEAGLDIEFDNETAKGGADLLYATASTATGGGVTVGEVVDFTMGHMLSRVGFKFTNGFTNKGTSIVVRNVKITDAVSKAKINKAAGEMLWSKDGVGTFGIDFVMDENAKAQTASTASEPMYLIPLVADATAETPSALSVSYTVTFTLDLCNDEGDPFMTYEHQAAIPATAYTNGCSYLFNTTINESNANPAQPLQPIEFNVEEVTVWGTDTEGNLPKTTVPTKN